MTTSHSTGPLPSFSLMRQGRQHDSSLTRQGRQHHLSRCPRVIIHVSADDAVPHDDADIRRSNSGEATSDIFIATNAPCDCTSKTLLGKCKVSPGIRQAPAAPAAEMSLSIGTPTKDSFETTTAKDSFATAAATSTTTKIPILDMIKDIRSRVDNLRMYLIAIDFVAIDFGAIDFEDKGKQ